MVQVVLYNLIPVAVGIVVYCLFLYISSFVICTSLGLSGSAFYLVGRFSPPKASEWEMLIHRIMLSNDGPWLKGR